MSSSTLLRYSQMPSQLQKEVRMYGCTEAEMREAVEQSLALRFRGPAMMAASILSDCQEMLATDNSGSYDFMVVEDVRQALNRAKYILFNYVSESKG